MPVSFDVPAVNPVITKSAKKEVSERIVYLTDRYTGGVAEPD